MATPRKSNPQKDKRPPLVFDLDGTLTQTDCLWEAVATLLTRHPAQVPGALIDVLRTGRCKATIKAVLTARVGIAERHLPLRKECIDLLIREKQTGRVCVLCTGSPDRWVHEFVEQVKAATGLEKPFDHIVCSNGEENITGGKKVTALQERFGTYDYVGNSPDDIPVWQKAETALLAGHQPKTKSLAKKAGITLLEISPAEEPVPWGKALRVHQWAKNLLIFVPLISAHAYFNPKALGMSLAAFTAFCLAASGNYLLNDTADAGNDRRHPSKKHRPIANGSIQIPHALLTAVLLILAGIGVAFVTSTGTGITLITYLAIATFYSHHGKTIPVLDTTILAALYCIRIWVGGEASAIPISNWLMATGLFLFFSLALGKRDAELSKTDPRGRGYRKEDRHTVASLGIAAGMLACGMLCLYTQSVEAQTIYQQSRWLWILPVVCLYWTSRFWMLCGRNEIHDDPVLWAARDKTSWLCGAIAGAALLTAHA